MNQIDPQKEPLIKKIFESKAYGIYRKKYPTLLRKPFPYEIGSTLDTYIKNNVESSSVVTANSIIARNEIPLENNHNEWVIPYKDAAKDYGKKEIDSLLFEFTPLYKKQTIKAVKITDLLLKLLNFQDIIYIKVPWSIKPMTGRSGDYLTDSGYIISAEFINTYELIQEPQKNIDEVLNNIEN
ncbi:MAG: hypothetical protein ACP5NA_07755 [Candidatus Acidulodesulfobacterium sp.]